MVIPLFAMTARGDGAIGISVTEGQGGAVVRQVDPGTPGARSGLQPGDVILAANGETLSSSYNLGSLLQKAAPGQTISLKVRRGTAETNLALQLEGSTLRAKPVQDPRAKDAKAQPVPPTNPKGPRLGVRLVPLAGEGAATTQGVLVLAVEPTSPAADAGLQPGDILQSIDGKAVGTPPDAASAIASAKENSTVTLKLLRSGAPLEKKAVVRSYFTPLQIDPTTSWQPAADRMRRMEVELYSLKMQAQSLKSQMQTLDARILQLEAAIKAPDASKKSPAPTPNPVAK
jgi:S1-C subfamily serine protease